MQVQIDRAGYGGKSAGVDQARQRLAEFDATNPDVAVEAARRLSGYAYAACLGFPTGL